MIDWTRVNDLRAEIGDACFDEVAVLFLEEADDAVLNLSAVQGAKALESALHFLKGSALNLGFQALAALCQEGERHAKGGAVDVDLDQITLIYAQSKATFHAGQSVARSA